MESIPEAPIVLGSVAVLLGAAIWLAA